MKMKMRQRGLVQGLLALVVAAACGSDSSVGTISATPSPTAQATTTPTSQPTPTPTTQPTPTPAGILDDHFGFLIQKTYAGEPIPGPVGWKVRRESEPEPLYTLHTGSTIGLKVSPDGRRVAYWSGKDLRVLDIAPDARPLTLLTIGSKENSAYTGRIAWSSDGTGLVAGVVGPPAVPGSDAPPAYTALRVVDVVGGKSREIVRSPAYIVPVAWDRKARLIAAYQQMCCGAGSYYVIGEDGAIKSANVGSTLALYVVEASQDGQQMLGRGDPNSVVRVWPRDSYERGVELRSANGERIFDAAWRPGTSEIGVLFANRLELWTASGQRRTYALPRLPALPAKAAVRAGLRFRANGYVAIVDRAVESGTTGARSNETGVAVDLASGVVEEIQWGITAPGPGWSVLISPTQ